MSCLLTGDLHFTDNPKDEYRWGLFDFLIEQVNKLHVHEVILLGDLTDAKDRHSAALVNRLVTSLRELSKHASVHIIKGNHDFIDEDCPFFGFLSNIADLQFYSLPTETPMTVGSSACHVLFLPHTKDPHGDWAPYDFNDYSYIFTHQTYDGCVVENGSTLQGLSPSIFRDFRGQVYSGDIHVPQKVSDNVEYVGAPYRVRFGDRFFPRVLHISADNKAVDLFYPAPFRQTVEIDFSDKPRLIACLEKAELRPLDQIKVRVVLKPTDYPLWPEIKETLREYVEEHGLVLCGVELKTTQSAIFLPDVVNIVSRSSLDVLRDYVAHKELEPALCKVGQDIMEKVL